MKTTVVIIALLGTLASANHYYQQQHYPHGGYNQPGYQGPHHGGYNLPGYPRHPGYPHHHYPGGQQPQYPENKGVPLYPNEPSYPNPGYPGQPSPYNPIPQPGPYDPLPTKKPCSSTPGSATDPNVASDSTSGSSDASEASTVPTSGVSGPASASDSTGASSATGATDSTEGVTLFIADVTADAAKVKDTTGEPAVNPAAASIDGNGATNNAAESITVAPAAASVKPDDSAPGDSFTVPPVPTDPTKLQEHCIGVVEGALFGRKINPIVGGNGTALDWKLPTGPRLELNLSASIAATTAWGSASLPGLDLKALPASTPKCVPDKDEASLTLFNFAKALPRLPTSRCACPVGKGEVIITKGDANALPATYLPGLFSLSAVVGTGRGCPTVDEFEICLTDTCCKIDNNLFTAFSIYPHCTPGVGCKNRLVFQHINDKIKCENGKTYSYDEQRTNGVYKPLDESYPEVVSISCGKTPKPFSCLEQPKLPAPAICPLPKEKNALLLTDIVLGPVGVASGYCLCPETHAFTFPAYDIKVAKWSDFIVPTFLKANPLLSCPLGPPLCACNSVTKQCWQVSNPPPEDIAFVPFCSDNGCWYNMVLNRCSAIHPNCSIIDRKDDKSLSKEQFDQVKQKEGQLNSAYPIINTVSCGCERALKLAQGSCSKTLLGV